MHFSHNNGIKSDSLEFGPGIWTGDVVEFDELIW
jgi:hypothetical protein